MEDLYANILIITLKACNLNMPIKKTESGKMHFKKKDPPLCSLQEICFKFKNKGRLKVKKKKWKKVYHPNINQIEREREIILLICDAVD